MPSRGRTRPMATILLVGVDLMFRSRLEGLLDGHRLVTSDSADPPDLVICDIARIDAEEVADAWPETPILGFTNHTDTVGLQRAHTAGLRPGDRQVGARRARAPGGRRARRRTTLDRPGASGAVGRLVVPMTYIIAEPCIDIKDRSCVDVCPVDCIHEFDRMLIIDPEECIDCGACEPECPVEAIFPEDALPDKWEPFVKINYAFPEGAGVDRPARPGVRRRAQRPERAARTSSRSAIPQVRNRAADPRPSGGAASPEGARSSGRDPPLCRSPFAANHSRAADGGTTSVIVVQRPSRRASNVPLSSAARSARPSMTA